MQKSILQVGKRTLCDTQGPRLSHHRGTQLYVELAPRRVELVGHSASPRPLLRAIDVTVRQHPAEVVEFIISVAPCQVPQAPGGTPRRPTLVTTIAVACVTRASEHVNKKR